MKIVNKTTNKIAYLVTPSGTVLSGSPIIASGTLESGDKLEFAISGERPVVYVKSAEPYNQGYLGIQPEDGNATVKVVMNTNEPD